MIQKLTAQVNLAFEDSSPSFLQESEKKRIPNDHMTTGRYSGGQPGHKGYYRKAHVPTENHEILALSKYTDGTAFYETRRANTQTEGYDRD